MTARRPAPDLDPEIAAMLEKFHAAQRAPKTEGCRWCGYRATAPTRSSAYRKVTAHMKSAHPGGPGIFAAPARKETQK